MNKKMKLLCVLLSILFLTAPLGIAAATPTASTTSAVDTSVPAAEYDFSNRRSPISILMYIEKTDLSSGGEFENTYQSILDTYGPAFQYENLTDYTDLSSMINAFDVFLILEQEVNSENFTTIGASWAGTLTDFVASGGIVISLDGGLTISDIGAVILNATGLIRTANAQQINPATVSIVNNTDALAFGVTTTFASPNAAFAYDVLDGTVVVKHDATSKAFAVHRRLGDGHAVLIGSDFFSRNANVDDLLANAIRLTRLAVFDNSHSQLYNPLSGYNDFAVHINTNYGFAIATMNTWDETLVGICDVLVAGSGGYAPIASYSIGEIDFIKSFVADGGGLLVETDWDQWGNNTVGLLSSFGFSRNYTGTVITDSDENGGDSSQPIYGLGNIANHSATLGVSTIQMYYGNAFIAMPANAKPLVWSDSDGTAVWSLGGIAANLPVAASLIYGAGRIVALADCNLFNDGDNDGDASHDFFDENNEAFAAGIMNWLSAAGIPEKTILFDESHVPTYNLQTKYLNFAYFLTLNGYTLRWMTNFYDGLINTADVLVIVDGATDYTAPQIDSIVSYVDDGGSLYLLGDWGVFGQQIAPIGAEFGLVINGTGYLTDTDDYNTYDSVIAYNTSNFANHPIMQGVNHIELDRSCGFSSVGAGVALVRTDNDGTSFWSGGSPADNVPVIAATIYNRGRVVFVPDMELFSTDDPDSDGFVDMYESDNDIFNFNTFAWLVANRAPTVHVLFPNGGEVLNGTKVVTWSAVDLDSDSLTYDVFYSANNGTDWVNLALGLLVSEYTWNTTVHPDGNSYMIRVVASDGQATGQDQSDGAFELDNFISDGGLPLDPMLLLLIGAGVIIVVIIIVIIMKKGGGGKK
ncbi:MAG: hypothetical protein ACFFDV_07925 [Candidatus Thorarchaeota archaeon]